MKKFILFAITLIIVSCCVNWNDSVNVKLTAETKEAVVYYFTKRPSPISQSTLDNAFEIIEYMQGNTVSESQKAFFASITYYDLILYIDGNHNVVNNPEKIQEYLKTYDALKNKPSIEEENTDEYF